MYRTLLAGMFLLTSCVVLSAADRPLAASAGALLAQVEDISSAPRASSTSKAQSVFSYPSGLSMSAECLFCQLGQYPAGGVPMTSTTTYDLAYACFIRGLYSDAVQFANRGISIRPDARLYLIRGVSEMHLCRYSEAEATVGQYLSAVDRRDTMGLEYARERISGPMRVRFEQIIRHVQAD
jgi:hypothetical protein